MRYVRHAQTSSEQNLSLHQIRGNLYFTALRRIVPDEELKVWYSVAYATARNLPVLNLDNNENESGISEKENVSGFSKKGEIR